MSQTQRGHDARFDRDDGPVRLTDAESVQQVLDAFEDADCRAILEATSGGWLTVDEIGDRCDLAQSTAYRKVDMLAEADLLEESLRIQSSGTHVSTYACAVDDVTLAVAEDGIELSVTRGEQNGADALLMAGD